MPLRFPLQHLPFRATAVAVLLLLCGGVDGLAADLPIPANVTIGIVMRGSLWPVFGVPLLRMFDKVNENSSILPTTKLVPQWYDVGTSTFEYQRACTRMVYGNLSAPTPNDPLPCGPSGAPVAAIGGLYSDVTKVAAGVCSAFQVPIIGVRAEDPELGNRFNYPFHMRTYPSSNLYPEALGTIFNQFNWTKVAIVHLQNGYGQSLFQGISSLGLDVLSCSYSLGTPDDEDTANDPDNLSEVAYSNMGKAVSKCLNNTDYKVLFVIANTAGKALWRELVQQGALQGDNKRQLIISETMRIPSLMYAYDHANNEIAADQLAGTLLIHPPPPAGDLWEEIYDYIGEEFGRRLAHMTSSSALNVVAQGLHNLLHNNDTAREYWGTSLHDAMMEVELRDSWAPDGVNFLPNGDRPVDLQLSNFDPQATKDSNAWVWNKKATLLYGTQTVEWDLENAEITFYHGETVPPLDHTPDERVVLEISSALRSSMLAAFVSAMVFSAALLAFNLAKRREKMIKMSSANFNNVLVIGCLACLSSIFLFSPSTNYISVTQFEIMCTSRMWLLSMGYTVAFGSLFLKTFRVWRIFESKDIGPVEIPDHKLFFALFSLLAVDGLILGVWQAVDPLHYHTNTQRITGLEVRQILIQESCSSEHFTPFLVGLATYKGLLLVVGAFLAWKTRRVSIPILNDSHLIGFSIYNVMIISVFLLPLSYYLSTNSVSQQTVDGTFALVTTGLLIMVVLTLAFVFLPKIYVIFRGSEVDYTTSNPFLRNTRSKARMDQHTTNPSQESSYRFTKSNVSKSQVVPAALRSTSRASAMHVPSTESSQGEPSQPTSPEAGMPRSTSRRGGGTPRSPRSPPTPATPVPRSPTSPHSTHSAHSSEQPPYIESSASESISYESSSTEGENVITAAVGDVELAMREKGDSVVSTDEDMSVSVSSVRIDIDKSKASGTRKK